MSEPRADGGPAFPSPHDEHFPSNADGGMSLRDYFAAQALVGFLAASAHPESVGLTELDSPKLASDVYKLADAMLKERAK